MQSSNKLTLGKRNVVVNTEFAKGLAFARASEFLARYGWLLTGVVCLVLGYILIWQRGPLLDDYANRLVGIQLLNSGRWIPFLMRAGLAPRLMTNLSDAISTAMLPQYEFEVRLISSLVLGVDAFLLGRFIYRIFPSRLVVVISSWLFLMPFYPQEAALWLTATSYLYAMLFVLLYLHAFWSALTEPQHMHRWIIMGTLGFVIALSYVEQTASALIAIPILALTLTTEQGSSRSKWGVLARSLYILIWPIASAALIYFLTYRSSHLLVVRGGLVTSPQAIIERLTPYFDSLQEAIVSAHWALPLVGDAFQLGVDTLGKSGQGLGLFVLASLLCLLTLVAWKSDAREYQRSWRAGLIVSVSGVAWFFATLLFPAILVQDQGVAYRMLYLPGAGLAIAIATCTWMAAQHFKSPAVEKFFLAATGGVLLLSTVCTLGYSRAYAARVQLDQKQVAAVVRAVPADTARDSTLVIFGAEKRLFGKDDVISLSMSGVFESSWSARAALAEAYGRRGFHYVGEDKWADTGFSIDPQSPSNGLRAGRKKLPINSTILIMFRGDAAFAIEKLQLQGAGAEQSITFPKASTLRVRGIPTIESYTVSEQ